jgi:hypothetical protein
VKVSGLVLGFWNPKSVRRLQCYCFDHEMIVALYCCIDFGTVLELRLNLQISQQLKYAAVDLTVVVRLLSFWQELGFNAHLLGWYFLRERERCRFCFLHVCICQILMQKW